MEHLLKQSKSKDEIIEELEERLASLAEKFEAMREEKAKNDFWLAFYRAD